MIDSLAAVQVALEEEALAKGQAKYWENVSEAVADGNEDTTRPVMQLIRRSVASVAEGIKLRLEESAGKGRGKRHAAIPLVRDMDPEVLAFHTLRHSLATVSTNAALTPLCIRIGAAVIEEVKFSTYAEANERRYASLQRHLKKSSTGARKRAVANKVAENDGVEVSWTEDQKLQVGAWLVDTMLLSTTLFEVGVKPDGGRTRKILRATQEVLQWIAAGHDRSSLMLPCRMPMVVQPQAWSTPEDGGYLTDIGGRPELIKTRNRNYLQALADVDMPAVYAAINAIQSVRWAINKGVLDVAQHCWDRGIQVGSSMPMRDPEPLPSAPFDLKDVRRIKAENYELYKDWAIKAAATYERNAKLAAKRMGTVEKLNLAAKFAGFDAIWFPHTLDFRGRVYPLPAHLHPQGDDLARGLLMFADGKPITRAGIWWLKVHIANCFGVDKVSMEERVAWVDRNLEELMDSGLEPLDGGRRWMQAEDPWQALAACMELVGAVIQGPDYVSRLSIPMDGSCNGLQNFSAMLKDPVGGKATNLLPSDKPADIYAEVSKVVAARVRRDAEAGVAEAQLWDGNISRKIVKQPVMTLPYGATKSGMRGQIEQAAKKNLPGLLPVQQSWGLSSYLAEVTYNAIGEVVVAARQAMDWLREAAKLAAGEDYPVRWTTPMGLPVLQEYRQRLSRTKEVHIDGAMVKLELAAVGEKLDRRRQATGISPNFIHSLDAAHMQRTVLIARDNGIKSLGLIHDSFGTLAADTDMLHACIREAFVQQYSEDVLGRFAEDLRSQLPPEAVAKLPPLPPMGTLDLDAVRESRYFFA